MSEIDKLIESEIRRPTVFIDESVLYPEYVPKRLPHRETHVRKIAAFFKAFSDSPGRTSVRVVLVGPVGTGKTATAIAFGRAFSRMMQRRGVLLRYVHVNCSKSSNPASIFRDIKNQLGLPLPDRGLSAREMAIGLLKMLERENMYVIVTLDEIEYFIKSSSPSGRFLLLRFYDVFKEDVKRLNFIYVTRGSPTGIQAVLDSITGSYLMENVIPFQPYTAAELMDILNDRVKEAFYEGVVDEEVVESIARLTGYDTGGDGNARKAIAILHAAGKLADKELAEGRASRVTVDHVRAVVAQEYQSLIDVLDKIYHLELHEVLILKAIVLALYRTGESFIPMGEIERTYREICEELGEEPRKHTRVYMLVMDLKRRGIIITKTSMKGRRGRSTYVGFAAAPLDRLLEKLNRVIEEKRLMR